MLQIIHPDNIGGRFSAFFTTKSYGTHTGEIAALLGADPERFYLPIQKHTDKIVILSSADSLSDRKIADAVITTLDDVFVGVAVADCVPILLASKTRGVIGAVHAGWRGTAQEIIKKTIAVFFDRFSCPPHDVFVAFGPSIRKNCYAVGEEVVAAVVKASGPGDYISISADRCHIDLTGANRQQALSMDIPALNIWESPECTFCNPQRFHSYRYAKTLSGRQGAFIAKISSEIPRTFK